jgi:hypothetical protein
MANIAGMRLFYLNLAESPYLWWNFAGFGLRQANLRQQRKKNGAAFATPF